MPTRMAPPRVGHQRVEQRAARRPRSSSRVLSSRVIARAMARRSPRPDRVAATRAAAAPGRAARRLIRRRSRSTCSTSAAAFGIAGARTEHRGHALLAQERVVAGRDDAAHHHGDVAGAFGPQRVDQLGHEGLVAGRLARHAHHVDVVLDRLARGLLGRLEERTDVHVEAEVGEGGGDHLHAAVVAVLAELHDQHARAAPLLLGEGCDVRGHRARSPRRPGSTRSYTPETERISARWRV